jgi:hypothetical protein
MGVSITSMSPVVCYLAVVHRPAAAQIKRPTTDRADGLQGRSRVGNNLFSICCASYFHGSPERFLCPVVGLAASFCRFSRTSTTSPENVIPLNQVHISLMDKP